ncbi:MAG: winged helix-turn-helix transcriptional regulator [Candidatus Thorarchaeota archaeon]
MKTNDSACNSDVNGELCLCPLEGIIETVSKKWTLQIVTVVGNQTTLRYSEIQERLEGISPTSLAGRLKELVQKRLLRREVYAEIPPRVQYSLTEDGEELRRLVIPLMNWAANRTR